MSFYIKYGDDILDYDVIKIADIEHAAGMPLGTAVKSVVFSFIGVFVLELITGVCGMLGILRHSKTMLSIVSSDYERELITKKNLSETYQRDKSPIKYRKMTMGINGNSMQVNCYPPRGGIQLDLNE